MFCCRALVLPLAILATAAAVCANLFAVFRKGTGHNKSEQTLWYSKADVGSGIKEMVKDSPCDQYKLFFEISEGGAAGGAGVGFIICVLAIAQLCSRQGMCCLKCITSLFVTLAFAGCGACVGLLVFGYMKGYCQNDDSLRDAYAPFKDSGYQFAEGFYLIC
ncbi:hypothetical protein DQ04_24521000, partial [Trypanosoma grayi]|uniref:hypothetical protein n=1 Tax=Trypanosoma grayi TaxID=71804 RepID=UPI0004F458D0